MKIVLCLIHAYLYLTIYELLIEEKQFIVKKWIFILLIGIAKFVSQLGIYTKYIFPFILCTLLVLYAMGFHGRNSNLKNLQYSVVTYGIESTINMVLSFGCAMIAGVIGIEEKYLAYVVLSIGRILVIIGLYKGKKYFEKLKQSWVLYIVVIATIVLLFTELILRLAYKINNDGLVYIGIIFIYLAVFFTILWLLDHYKMAKIQKMYAEDNKQMSQKLHRSKEILPMIANYASSMDAAQDEEMRKKLEAVCHDYGKELGGAEMSAELFETTGIDLVDLLLKTKITECVEQDIELDVFVGTQIHKDMKRLDIGDGEIARLIGDLLRNAIHAVNGLKNKMILLLIVKDEDEHVLIRIYDSGIPFPPYILERFGERGNTTWGTGNGLADMMDTLKRVHASIEVNTEMAPGDVFTKEICICFDREDRVKIPHNDKEQNETA